MLNKKSLKFTIIDIAVITFIIAAIFLFFSRMSSALDYKWRWDAMPSYFFFLDAATGKLKANILVKGFATTVKLSFWATLLGFLLGTISGVMGAKGSFEQRFVSRTYVETIRNIPSLVLVIIFYYFVSSQFLDALYLDKWLRSSSQTVQQIVGFLFSGPGQINSFLSAVVALGIYEGAYVSEIVRGGIISIPDSQWEASWSIGLSRQKTFLLVILPQTFRRVAFPLAGQFISTIKDSAIVSVISIQELTFQGMELMSTTFLTFEIWITITFLYFTLTFPLSRSVAFLEKKYALKQ
ncbi:amino acid ABC transporter permease [Desulfobacula sp.]|uniref:amino acid ABC transporter permease n=1 Tax=Desulfobacula sp. TaxID=2593537 RepID=UPI0026283C3F|nr:amino acid ABC transporter permease [Desulfobacula sp.]